MPAKARFIEPILLLRTEKLPDGSQWAHELKFDGYRALAIKSGGKVQLRSRNDNDFNSRYPGYREGAPIHFFIFDVLVLKGQDVMGEPLFC